MNVFRMFLNRKEFITVDEHERLIRAKNDTIRMAIHVCLEQEKELNALRTIVARQLVGGA